MVNMAVASAPKRILLAEDDPEGVELTLAALAEAGLADDMETVTDGQEVLDYLYRRGKYQDREPGNPAVILLDLKMPRVSGLEALEQIRNDAGLAAVPVAVLTSSTEESDVAACYRLRANAYVVKPVDFAEFLDTVKNLGAFWAKLNEPPFGSVPRRTAG
jgi:CheY-like chemotaxis protein